MPRRKIVAIRPVRKGRKLNKKQKQEVKQIIAKDIEKKSFNYSKVYTAVDAAGSYIYQLSGIALGNADAQRVGEALSVKQLRIRYTGVASAGGLLTAADAYDTLRVIVFRWRVDDNYELPTAPKLLSIGTLASYINAPYNEDISEKATVIYDHTFTCANAVVWNGTATLSAPGGPQHSKSFKKTIYGKKMGAKTIRYTAGTTNGVNNFWVLAVSDSAFAGHPQLEFSAAFDYTDA